jgi:hypothetical protein
MREIVEQLANVMLSEVPVKRFRRQILKRLAALVKTKERAADAEV